MNGLLKKHLKNDLFIEVFFVAWKLNVVGLFFDFDKWVRYGEFLVKESL